MMSNRLYPASLGSTFATLAEPLHRFHDGHEKRMAGRADIRRGDGMFAKIACIVFGFPETGADVAIAVEISVLEGGERWVRDFGGRKLLSWQMAGKKRDKGRMIERFGPIAVAVALIVRDGKLFFVPRRWSVFGIPLPRILLPAGETFESEVDGRFNFDVAIRFPFLGDIVSYRGYLA